MPRKANNKKHTIDPKMLQVAIDKEMKNAAMRLAQRLNTIQKSINKIAIQNIKFQPHWKVFKINNPNQLINNCLSILKTWDGGKYDTPITNAKTCFEKTRNFWCREKYKPIGTKLFYPIFCQLYKHIDSLGFTNVCEKDKILLFIDIMNGLLDEEIKFLRTSAKPVILHATFFKANKFKEFCGAFLEIFHISKSVIQWGSVKVTKSVRKKNNRRATSQYIRDPHRATALHDSFVMYLKDIKLHIINCNDMKMIKCLMKRFKDWISNNSDGSNMIPMNEEIKENDEEINDCDMEINSNNLPPNISSNNKRSFHVINAPNNNNNWAPSVGYNRSFQNVNRFIHGPNRVHNNMYRLTNRNDGRKNARELHIRQMRMQPLYNYNLYYYPYPTGTCCCNHNILPQHTFNAINYTHVAQPPHAYTHPLPQFPPPQPIPPVYAPNIRTQLPIINTEEVQSTSMTNSPMTNSFTVTPEQGPQLQLQSHTQPKPVPLPETIGSNINGDSINTRRVASFRMDNNNGDSNGNSNSIFNQIAYNNEEDEYLEPLNTFEFDQFEGDNHYHPPI